MSASGLRSLWSKPKSALGKDPVEGGDRQSTLHTAEITDLFTGYTPAQNGRTNVISSEGGMWQPITQPGSGTSSVLDQPQANLRAAATLPRRGRSPFGPGEMTSDVFTSPVSERVSPVGHWGPTSSATLSSPVSRTSPEMRAFYGSYADPNKTASLGSTSGTTMNPITSPTLFSHSRHFGTDFTTSAAYDQADDDVPFYSRDVSTLPRRNHTIASSAAAYRKRLDRQFDQGPSSTGLLSPSKNSLSAITGGAEEGEDDWEAMLKRKESLIPNDEEENEVLDSANWRPIGYPAFANAHRRFPSQPVSTFGTSPVDAHSPISTRSGGHQRSESVGVNRLDQGPFASSPIVHGTGFGSGSGAIVRRHQSLNHHAGRNAISRLNGMRNALPEGAFLDRSPEDNRQEQSSANRRAMNYNLAPGHQVNAQQLSQFTYPARPAQKTTPPQARQEPTDPFDPLSLQSLQLNDRRPPENLPSKPVLSSLVTDREDLMRGASQQPFDGEGSRKALDGPASASAYVPPIGHGHHRRHSSSSSPSHYVPKNDAVRAGGTTAADAGTRSRHNDGGRSGIANLHGLQTAHPLQARQRIDQLPWHQRADTPTQDSVQQAINTLPMNMRTTQPSTATMLHGNGPAAYQMPAYYVDSTSQAGNAPLLDMRGNVVHAPQNAMHWPMPMATAPGGVNGLGAAFYASDGNVAHLSTAPLTSHTPPIPQLQPQQQQKSSSNLMDPSLLALIAAKGYNPPTTLFNVHPARARFFVIKSFTEDDVQRSLKHEIWASTEKGNQRLDRAFKESSASGPLYLLFSVNASGHFCGVAEMLTPLDYTSDSTVWVQEGKWKGTFKVRWIYVKDVPNNRLRHIRLTNTTDCKPITQSRDTQELPSDGGRLALKIIAEFPSRTTLLQGSLLS